MAQSVEEIYNQLIAEKQNLSALNNLMPQYNLTPPATTNPFIEFLRSINSNSSTGMWRLWLFIVAVAIRAQQILFDEHVEEVKTYIANHKPGTLLWYRSQMFLFQSGYLLHWVDGKYKYLIDDPSARITAQCAVERAAGVRVKAAKRNAGGGLQKFSASEIQQAQAYLDRIRYADHDVLFFSFDPDEIRVSFLIKYDPLADLPALKLQVKNKIKEYLSFLGENDFGGEIVLNKIIDELQKIDAVRNPVPLSFLARYGALPYLDYQPAGGYKSNAGYAIMDEAYFDTNTLWEAAL
jgi:hypothetical protein